MGGTSSSNRVRKLEDPNSSSSGSTESEGLQKNLVTSSIAGIQDIIGCAATTDAEVEAIPGAVDHPGEENEENNMMKTERRPANVPANISGTRYDIVRKVIKDSGYIINRSMSSYLIWFDHSVPPERIAELQPYQRINHFPDMVEIGRKDLLSRNISKMAKNHPKEFNFVPKTWIFPFDYQSFMKYARTLREKRTFIMKPANGSQGCGITLHQDPFQIPVSRAEHVVQEYVRNPMLVDGYKCDMRIYVLVTSCDPLRIYVYKDGLLRLGTEKYVHSDRSLKNTYVHLTNYTLNRNNINYTKGEDFSTGSKRSLTFYTDFLREQNYDVDKLWANIHDVIIKTMIVAEPHLLHSYRVYRPSLSSGNESVCFQILGFDVLVDTNLKPWLLEVNIAPSFDTDERIDQEVKSGLLEDAFHLLNIRASDRTRHIAFQKVANAKRLQRHSSRMGVKRRISVDCRGIEKERRELELLLDRVKREAKMDEYETGNRGGYTRIFPAENQMKRLKYSKLLSDAFATIPLPGVSPTLQKEIDLIYGSKLKESDLRHQIAECDATEQRIRAKAAADAEINR